MPGATAADGVGAAENWDLARNSTLVILTEVALEKLAEWGASETQIDALRTAVQELLAAAGPFDAEEFADNLDEVLRQAA